MQGYPTTKLVNPGAPGFTTNICLIYIGGENATLRSLPRGGGGGGAEVGIRVGIPSQIKWGKFVSGIELVCIGGFIKGKR